MVKRPPSSLRSAQSRDLGGVSRALADAGDDDDDDACLSKVTRCLKPLERATLDKLVAFLERNPDRIFEEFIRITESGAGDRSKGEHQWNSTYVYWKSISKKWLANLIAEVAGQDGLDTNTLNEVDAANGETIRLLCNHFFGIRKEEKFPRACLDKAVMRDYLVWLGEQLGSRWKDFKTRGGLRADFTIDWGKLSPFEMTCDTDGRVASIRHKMIVGGIPQTVDATIHIDKTWQVIHPYCDRSAAVKNRMLCPRLLEFFTDTDVASFLELWDEEARATKAKQFKVLNSQRLASVTKLDNDAILSKGEEQERQKRVDSAKKRRGPKTAISAPIDLVT